MVGQHLHAFFRPADRQWSAFGKQLGHQAFVVRGKVLNDDQGQAAVNRHRFKKGLDCLQAAGGSADSDIMTWCGVVFFHGFHQTSPCILPLAGSCPAHFFLFLFRADCNI